MATIHDELDSWLTADLHGELSDSERSALHAHLVECAVCRRTHQETKTMNKILEETLADEKADPAFEERMLAGFRNRIPQTTGVVKLFANLIRLRAAQIAAVAAVLLGLVQIGRMITGESATPLRNRKNYASEDFVARPGQAGASRADQSTSLAKSDELARGRSQDSTLNEPPSPTLPASRSELDKEAAARPMGLAAAKTVAATPENLARAEQAESKPGETPAPVSANRKLIRNATVELEIARFDDAVQKITAFANEERGYVATTNSEKQANGKLRGQVAKVTDSLPEKDMEEPAAFLLKERPQPALYAPDVEKIYNDIKSLASPKVQITNAQLNRDYSGRVSARMSMLIAPEESEGVIGRVKGFGRAENFQTQTERIAQGGSGMSENARTKRDKVELNVTISREEQEQAFQQTSLRIRTASVDEKAKELGVLAGKQGGRVRSSTFNRDPDGREVADVSLRVPMKNYPALMQSLNSLGKVENVSVQRQDRTGTQIDEANAPVDISIQVYSQGNIVSHESGLLATLRRTVAQSAGAIMWSLRMIGVAVAFLAPWVIAIVGVIWITRRVVRAKR